MASTLSKTLCLEGRVSSGSGEGAKFIELPWVETQITEKLGFVPYRGTLNIRLTRDSANRKEPLRKAEAIEISPDEGFCHARCHKAIFMEDLECAVVIPEVANYPKDVLEVIAPVNLRKKFRLRNGVTVQIEIILQ